METDILYMMNTATKEQLDLFLENNRTQIPPPPPPVTNCEYDSYGGKLSERANRFEAWDQSGCLIVLVAAYFNEQTKQVWIPYVCVSERFHRRGIANELFKVLLSKGRKYKTIGLEVWENNNRAIALYKKVGFKSGEVINGKIQMIITNRKE